MNTSNKIWYAEPARKTRGSLLAVGVMLSAALGSMTAVADTDTGALAAPEPSPVPVSEPAQPLHDTSLDQALVDASPALKLEGGSGGPIRVVALIPK